MVRSSPALPQGCSPLRGCSAKAKRQGRSGSETCLALSRTRPRLCPAPGSSGLVSVPAPRSRTPLRAGLCHHRPELHRQNEPRTSAKAEAQNSCLHRPRQAASTGLTSTRVSPSITFRPGNRQKKVSAAGGAGRHQVPADCSPPLSPCSNVESRPESSDSFHLFILKIIFVYFSLKNNQ